jgi:transcriptional regulator with XRE-family HTH domain
MPEMPLGERIAQIRRRRGMTQEELADRAGVSPDVIRKLEQGRRTGAKLATLNALARGLSVRTSELLTPDVDLDPAENGDKALLLDVRRILFPAMGDQVLDRPAADIEAIRAGVGTVRAAYARGAYRVVLGEFSELLPAIEIALASDTSTDTARLAALAFKALAETLIQTRHDDLAQEAVRRSLVSAEGASDPILYARCGENSSWIMLLHGRFVDAEVTASYLARTIEPSIAATDRRRLDTYGRLRVQASAAASRDNNVSAAQEHISVARAVAARLGGGDLYTSRFGPARVAMAESENAIVQGNPETALRVGRTVRLSGTPGKRHLLTLAEAQLSMRDFAGAAGTLNGARALAPEWLVNQRLARSLVRDLLDSQGVRWARNSGLADLASEMKIAV